MPALFFKIDEDFSVLFRKSDFRRYEFPEFTGFEHRVEHEFSHGNSLQIENLAANGFHKEFNFVPLAFGDCYNGGKSFPFRVLHAVSTVRFRNVFQIAFNGAQFYFVEKSRPCGFAVSVKGTSGGKFFNLFFVYFSEGTEKIPLCYAEFRPEHTESEVAVIGDYKEPFRIPVEPSYGEKSPADFLRKAVHNGFIFFILRRGDDTAGFIEHIVPHEYASFRKKQKGQAKACPNMNQNLYFLKIAGQSAVAARGMQR